MVAVAVEVWAVVVVALVVVDAAWAIVEGGTTFVTGAVGAVVDRSLVTLVVVDAAWAIVEVGTTVVVVVGEAWVVAVVVGVNRELAVVSWEKDKQQKIFTWKEDDVTVTGQIFYYGVLLFQTLIQSLSYVIWWFSYEELVPKFSSSEKTLRESNNHLGMPSFVIFSLIIEPWRNMKAC